MNSSNRTANPLNETPINKLPATPRTLTGLKQNNLKGSQSERVLISRASSVPAGGKHAFKRSRPEGSLGINQSSRKLSASSFRTIPISQSSLALARAAKETPVRRPKIDNHYEDEDNFEGNSSLLPSSPFEQYPGLPAAPRTESQDKLILTSSPSQIPRPDGRPRMISKAINKSPSSSSSYLLSSSSLQQTPVPVLGHPSDRTPKQTSSVKPAETPCLLDFATPATQKMTLLESPDSVSNEQQIGGVFTDDDETPTREHQSQNTAPLQATSLLDLDFPIVTPRSIPSISTRQVESLKGEYLSQIASLKAELAGKDAELNSLRTSLRDAEDRNATLEQQIQAENDRMEKVAKELHVQYSKKHETKVTALKKQLEAKWTARISENERQIKELNEQLTMERREKSDLVQYWDQYLQAEAEAAEAQEAAETDNGVFETRQSNKLTSPATRIHKI
ncbi:central kinetochore-associated-domain-containing protein [Dipodascopsis uninucleata]